MAVGQPGSASRRATLASDRRPETSGPPVRPFHVILRLPLPRPALLFSFVLSSGCHTEPHAQPAVPVLSVPAPAAVSPPSVPVQAALLLPRPPSQSTPWTPPATSLPAPFVTSAQALFDEGLPDPRGLHYRAVEITVGDVWSGNGAPVATHAWVLPSGDAGPRFVVAWNGLVYPALSVGDAADLAADVAAIVAADEKMRATDARDNPGHDFYRFRHAWAEGMSASHQSLLPLKAVLLLRAGETKLAEDIWRAWTAGMRKDTNDDATHLADPYLMLATDWTWAAFDRAVCAHMRGDDPMAFAGGAALQPVRDAVAREAVRRGLLDVDAGIAAGTLGFMEPLDTLVNDESRRMARPARTSHDDAGAHSTPPADATVAELIDDLDLVSARQWGQPGGVSLGEDPIVQALVRKGDDAVEPLLACLETDARLTRSVHFWRDFAHSRSLLSVGEAAYVALSGILDASFFGPGSTGDDLSAHGLEGRKRVAAEVRTYWERWRGTSREERWFRVLASDDLPAERWLEAAANIARPDNVTVVPGSMFGSETMTSSTGTPPKARGEALRARTSPTVTELMARRVHALAGRPDGMPQATDMALLLHDWDAAGSLPSLQQQMTRCLAAMGGAPADKAKYAAAVAALAEARTDQDDRAALDEYAAWLVRMKPEDLGSFSSDLKRVLEPMMRHPADPAMKRLATAMFATRGSAWGALTHASPSNFWGLVELAESDLVRVPAFRDLVVASLSDHTKIGTVKIQSGGGISVTLDSGGSMGTGSDDKDPPPPAGTTFPLRACDLVAWELARRDHAPVFRIYWLQPQRDAALPAMVKYVHAAR
jgi:hypothetical protein